MEDSLSLREELGVKDLSAQHERDEFAALVDLPTAKVHERCRNTIMQTGTNGKNAALEVLLDRALAI